MNEVEAIVKGIPFVWHTFDMRPELPTSWQDQILAVARQYAQRRTLVPTSVTSRESSNDMRIPVHTIAGREVAKRLPWLYSLYEGRFRDLAQTLTAEPVVTASELQHGINLNIQVGGDDRYECH